MNEKTVSEIHEVIQRETDAWNSKSVDLLLSIFHPDMVWVWPPDNKHHDPVSWVSALGKFDYDRWAASYHSWFSTFELVRNEREIKKVFVTKEGDGGFAVVDIDTLWRSKTGEESHWCGRTCKTYAKTELGWKMISQLGALDYSVLEK